MITTIREMLDLPPEERHVYLGLLPLTRGYTFWPTEETADRFIHRTIVRCGGTYRDTFSPPGLSVDVTFKTYRGLKLCAKILCWWMNKNLTEYVLDMDAPQEEIDEALYDPETWPTRAVCPVLEFSYVNWLRDDWRNGATIGLLEPMRTRT